MLEFMGKKPIRKNLTIQPIILSNEQNQQLEKIMASEKGSIYKHWKIRKTMMNITGTAVGYCLSCGKLPTHIYKVPPFKSNISSKVL